MDKNTDILIYQLEDGSTKLDVRLENLAKGFTMDDERLKSMRNIGEDYFDELLERL